MYVFSFFLIFLFRTVHRRNNEREDENKEENYLDGDAGGFDVRNHSKSTRFNL